MFLPSEAKMIDGPPCMPTWNLAGFRDLKSLALCDKCCTTEPSP